MKVLPERTEKALCETGLNWSIEHGKRHWQIRLEGHLVGILPHGKPTTKDVRNEKNTIAQIRRKARELRK